jgi:DNA primase
MRYENLTFPESLRLLAGKAGIALPERANFQSNASEKDQLIRINEFAAKFYHEILKSSQAGSEARAYLQKRGLKEQTIQAWEIGFAPDEFHVLEQALLKKKVSLADMVKAGVGVMSEKGRQYDRFRGRVTFPIWNYVGDIIGFSARVLAADANAAKYINSPETLIYSKSRVLFGLYQAKEAIRKQQYVVVVEGQMDCISLHQAGFANTVATSGTALTSDHMQLLKRLAGAVTFCFDADEAGSRATRKAGELALDAGMRAKVVVLPKGTDPDELVRSNASAWREALKHAVWLVDYYIDEARKMQGQSVEQTKYVSESIVPLIYKLSDSLEQDHYVRKLVTEFGITESVIRSMLIAAKRGIVAPKTEENKISTVLSLEKEIIGALLLYPTYREQLLPEMDTEDFTYPLIQELFSHIKAGTDYATNEELIMLAKETQFMVESQTENMGQEEEAMLRDLTKRFYTLKLSAIRRHQQRLSQDIRQAEQAAQKEKLSSLNQAFAALSKKRIEYENKKQ